MSKHILVGFGGSGIKALTQFAKWVAQDYKIALKARSDYAFVCCDTDEADIREGQKAIMEALGKVVKQPIVKALSLSAGFGDRKFYTIAREILKDASSRGGADRLMQAWWHKDDKGQKVPFVAPTLEASVTDGAGQCPPVAAFLAWNKADGDQIRRLVQEILQEFQWRSSGGGAQEMQIQTYLIAGLSGGTGRGSWMPVGLEIAQHVVANGHQGDPQGFFFDATVQPDTTRQFIKQQVNALTGVSEVVAWIRNANDKTGPARMAFPSFAAPDNSEVDAVSTEHAFNGKGGSASPIQQAFLFGGQSKSARIKREYVYDMVGSAIFARIVQDSIAREEINEGYQRLGTMGVAQYWIPATRVRRVLTDRVTAMLPASLVKVDVDRLEAAKGRVVGNLQQWFRASETNPLKKAIEDRVSELGRPVLEEFISKVKGQKKAEAEAAANNLLPNATRDENLDAVIDHALARAFDVPHAQNASESLRVALAKAAAGLSLAETRELIQAVRAQLDGSKLLERMEKHPVPNVIQKIREYASSVAYFGWGDTFDEDEINSLRKYADDYIRARGVSKAAARLAKRLASIQADLHAWAGTLNAFISHIDTAFQMSRPQLEGEAEGLFTTIPASGNMAEAAHALIQQDVGDGLRFVSRQLRPVLNGEDLDRLVRETELQGSDQLGWLEKIRELAVGTSLGGHENSPRTFSSATASELQSLLGKLQSTVQVDQFRLEASFSFVDVVSRLVKHWLAVINAPDVRRDRTLQDEVAWHFKNHFGYPLQRHDDGFIEPLLPDVLAWMVRSLAADCDPLLTYEGRLNTVDRVKVFLPLDPSSRATEAFKDLERRIERTAETPPLNVKVELAMKAHNASPFMLMAVNTAWIDASIKPSEGRQTRPDELLATTLDKVTTFDYRHQGPVRAWLEAAEQPEGRSLFEPHAFGQGTYGFGYISPMFVHDKRWRELRWRPWAKDIEKQENQRQWIHADAAVWALAMMHGDHLGLLDAAVAEPLRAHLARVESAESMEHQAIGQFLRMAGEHHPGLKSSPFIVGPCAASPRYRVQRKLLTIDPVDRKLKVGTRGEDSPIGVAGFDSLRKLLDFLKDPKNAGISERMLEEKRLVHGLINAPGVCFNPALVELEIAQRVALLISEETIRLRKTPEISLLKAALDELAQAAARWVERCSVVAD